MVRVTYPTPWTVELERFVAGDPDHPDDYGNASDGYEPARTEPVYGWAPVATDEVNGSRNLSTADLALYAPPGFSCSARDRVTLEGRTYEVQGEVEDFGKGPFGFVPGVRVALTRSEAT